MQAEEVPYKLKSAPQSLAAPPPPLPLPPTSTLPVQQPYQEAIVNVKVQSNPLLDPSGTRTVSSSLADRFSTKATAMVGEGLVRYCVFMDVKSLTKLPNFEGSCAGKFCACFCTCVGGFENNRLVYMRDKIFPKLDGPVIVADINSKGADDDFFDVLNEIDSKKITRQQLSVAGGVFQRNVLYKMLPKEKVFVPAFDWAMEQERSEINEILSLFQAAGAIAVDYEHVPLAHQPGEIPDMPIEAEDTFGIISEVFGRCLSFLGKAAISSEQSRADAKNNAAISTLSGRVLFRSNERPPTANLRAVISSMGPDFYHLKSQPSILKMLEVRLSRGNVMTEYFTFKHYAVDTTHMKAMHELQGNNVKKEGTMFIPGSKMAEADVIDCGYRYGIPRPRFETKFMVVFPDIKDGLAMDPNAGTYTPGGWHPLSTTTTIRDCVPFAISDAERRATIEASAKVGDSSSHSSGSKDSSADGNSKSSSGGVGGVLSMINPFSKK